MSLTDNNPRATRGDNSDAIDYAKEEVNRLHGEYPHLLVTVEELTTEAEAIPEVIADDVVKDAVVDLIKSIRDASRRVESIREIEKQPHFRRGQGVDQFFNRMVDSLMRRDRKNNPGIGDVLNGRLTDYDARVLAAEQERRRLAAEAAERERQRLERERVEAERKAQEAREAAERARKPETTAAKTEVAQKADEAASAAIVEEAVATSKAEDAYVSTLARPADIMRTRTAGGTLSTVQREKYAEIEDQGKLDMAKLWPYIALAEKEKALRAWAKSTGHNEQMLGAKIGDRPKSVVR